MLRPPGGSTIEASNQTSSGHDGPQVGRRRFTKQRWEGRLEVMITIALGLAAVVTALAVYLEDNRDDDAQLGFSNGVRLITEATGHYVAGAQEDASKRAIFYEYVRASRDDVPLARYLLANVMDPDLRQEVLWWSDTPEGILTPFVEQNPYYTTPDTDRAQALTARGNNLLVEAKDDQDAGDRYILVGVILASALFLYGIAGVTRRWGIKLGTFGAGSIAFLVAVTVMVTG